MLHESINGASIFPENAWNVKNIYVNNMNNNLVKEAVHMKHTAHKRIAHFKKRYKHIAAAFAGAILMSSALLPGIPFATAHAAVKSNVGNTRDTSAEKMEHENRVNSLEGKKGKVSGSEARNLIRQNFHTNKTLMPPAQSPAKGIKAANPVKPGPINKSAGTSQAIREKQADHEVKPKSEKETKPKQANTSAKEEGKKEHAESAAKKQADHEVKPKSEKETKPKQASTSAKEEGKKEQAESAAKKQADHEVKPKSEKETKPKQADTPAKEEGKKEQAEPAAKKQAEDSGAAKSDTKKKESGIPANYEKVLDITATAYAPGPLDNDQWGDKTYLGTTIRPGVVAVDPKVIPLGSRLYVQYPDGHGEYAVAEDTGGAIKGNRIDIAMMDRGNATEFGIKPVKVYVVSTPDKK
jgi:3D (Asp-Asp-Asp) domain-containing protein